MATAYQAPGLYYEPVQPARTAGLLARGDIPAFMGLTRRGPLFHPVRVESTREVEALFGAPPTFGHLAAALRGFFETGGDAAYVVRIADPAKATAARAAIGGGWQAEASFNWAPIDPRRLRQTAAAASPAWVAVVEEALRDGARSPDVGAWGNRLSLAISRATLARTTLHPSPDGDAHASLADGIAGLERGSVVAITQGSHTGHLSVAAIDAVRQIVRWTEPLSKAGIDLRSSARAESVEFRIDVLLDGRLVERFEGASPGATHSRSITTMLADSRYVALLAPAGLAAAPDAADPLAWPDERTHALGGGRDGVATIGVDHYHAALAAIARADEVALVAAPDLVLAPVDLTPATMPPPAAAIDCCDLAPAPLGRIQARVVDAETGNPVVGAVVEAAGAAARAETDGDGRFVLAPVPLALTTIRIARPDYDPAELLLQPTEIVALTGDAIALTPLAHPRFLGDDAILTIQQAMAQAAGAYRVAIVDPPRAGMKPDQLLTWRAKLGDSARLALFAPWIVTPDGVAVPPSGHVCGALAAGERATGIHRAPANLLLRHVAALSLAIDDATQGVLNPAGVNAIRAFPGRGIRIWGARTLSSDPEWHFLTARRVVDAIERTLEAALQWAVFEPNGLATRQAIAFSIAALLERLWRDGVLAGEAPAAAFRVKCDDDNNPANAVARGELVAEVAVAPANPFEFVVFRIAKALDAISVAE